MVKALKHFLKKILFRPRGLNSFGENSYVKRPFLIKGSECIRVGAHSFIHKNAEIIAIQEDCGKRFDPLIEIGNHVYIGQGFHLHTLSKVSIGEGCAFSDHVYVSGASHGYHPDAGLIMEQALTYQGIVIGDHCFVGRNVFVSPGVVLGKGCVVGANAVVTKSFPNYSMIGGVPAKMLKKYSFEVNEWVRVRDE